MTTYTAAEATVTSPSARTPSTMRSLLPVAIDIAVPLAVYFGLRAAGVAMVTALIGSSVVPVARTVASLARDRQVNVLAALILATNVAGIVLSFVSGNVRVMFAKDAGISATIAIGILVSVVRNRPAMSAGLVPWVTKGKPERIAAWNRLSARSAQFRRLERRYSMIWGACLLAECLTRVVCAFTLPLSVLSWLPSALLVAAIVAAMIVTGGAAADPIEKLVAAEAEG